MIPIEIIKANDPASATSLPRIHKGMVVPTWHLQCLTAIIDNYEMRDKLAVHLLHSHEPLGEKEIKLERKLETIQGKWMRHVLADSIDPSSLHGLAFKIHHRDGENTTLFLVPYELGEGQSPISGDKRALECMTELAQYIVEKGLIDVLGLQLLDSDDLSAGPTAELEVEGFGTITLPQSMQKIEELVPVSWPSSVYDTTPQLSEPPPGQHWNVSTKPDGTKTHKVHVSNAAKEQDILKSLTDQGIIVSAF
jgi:hypothetical protein